MRSRYDAGEAARVVAELSPRWGEDLALRVYTSRLLGSDPALVLHGGGNTSVKTMRCEAWGEPVAVLHVKGSGADLGRIGPEGFPACRLEPLKRLCQLEVLSDDDMVRALRSQMLDPSSPTPSVEALLHAVLPGKFVDHTHADAVLAVQDQPRAAEIAAEIWGEAFLYVPYVMPGFVLARRVVELGGDRSDLIGLILGQHGIFTWGETAQESYERMIAGVSAAEAWRDAHRRATRATAVGPDTPITTGTPRVRQTERQASQAWLSPIVRGAVHRVGGGTWVAEWRDDEHLLDFLDRDDAVALTQRGTVTPDHVIRVRPRPAWLDAGGAIAARDVARTRAAVERALAEWGTWYAGYFERGSARQARALTRLDLVPRVVLVPGLGALLIGRTRRETGIAGDIVSRAVVVMQEAEAIDRFQPVSEADLFDVEYWSLEQAKLKAAGTPGAMAGRVVLITGAAAGIGRATAEAFLDAGAHVMLTDMDTQRLTSTAEELRQRYGVAVASAHCDVTDTSSVELAVARICREFGGLDIVVSNAGTAPSGLLHTDAGAATLERSLDINFLGHQRVARAATDALLKQGVGGCLLFNASKSAVNPGREFGPYAVAKAGVLALMRQYAIDAAPHGIRSNAVNADRIRTDLFGGGVLEARAKARGVDPDQYFRDNLLGRETTARDVADAFVWLARAEATTGCIVTVDGGNPAAFLR
ncbi:MAG TPA: bifunctional aldolase/short-chain dehydrogenase [Gemmatimonadaceae bacterium]